jgi:flagellar basal body-associated protein FliL
MKKHKQKNKRSVPTTETRSGSSSMQVIVALVIVSLCVALGYISYCFVTKSCTSSSVRKLTASQVIIKPPKGEIVAEVVDTPASREQWVELRLVL